MSENEDAEFAMIHDALEIKYQVYKDCNLTEIGEPFAEQPYAIAVQQGSHLNEEISRRWVIIINFKLVNCANLFLLSLTMICLLY